MYCLPPPLTIANSAIVAPALTLLSASRAGVTAVGSVGLDGSGARHSLSRLSPARNLREVSAGDNQSRVRAQQLQGQTGPDRSWTGPRSVDVNRRAGRSAGRTARAWTSTDGTG